MKKVLILNGSPRKNGYTSLLIDTFIENLNDEYSFEIIDCNSLNVNFCVDCRYCATNFKCVINDEMQEIYTKLENADILVFATPVYFYSVTAQIKTLIDRLQVYFYRHINGKNSEIKNKVGVLISVGGAKEYPNQFVGVETMTKGAMKDLNCTLEKSFFLSKTDDVDHDTLEALKLTIVNYSKTV